MSVYDKELRLRTTVQGTRQAEAQLKGFNMSIGKMAGAIGLATIAMNGIRKAFDFAKESLAAYERAVQAMKQVNTTLITTGRDAELSAQRLSDLANELQAISRFDDETILQESTLALLRFKDISNEMFESVQRLAIDLGEGMDSLSGASRLLGIVLSDPIAGLTRLRRAGVSLDETQQDLIKSLVQTGDKAKAQEILIYELEQRYGGLAIASQTASHRLTNAWGDFQEAMGHSMGFVSGIKDGIAETLSHVAREVDTTSEYSINASRKTENKWTVAWRNVSNAVGEFAEKTFRFIEGVVLNVYALIVGNKKRLDAVAGGIVVTVSETLKKIVGLIGKAVEGIESLSGKLFKKTSNKASSFVKSVESGFDKITASGKKSIQEFNDFADAYWYTSETLDWTSSDIENKYALRKGLAKAEHDIREIHQETAEITKAARSEELANLQAELEAEQALDEAKEKRRKNLGAWVDYYDTMSMHSDEWLNKQMELYEFTTRESYASLLSESQIQDLLRANELKLLKDIAEGKRKKTSEERRERITNLEAWENYYNTMNKHSKDWLDNQLELYEIRTRESYEDVLDEMQIQELLAAYKIELLNQVADEQKRIRKEELRSMKEHADKLKAEYILTRGLEFEHVKTRERYLEIKKEQLEEEYQAHLEAGANIIVLEQWKAEKMKEIIDGMPEHYKNVFERMDMYMLESAQRMKDGALSILSNAIYDIFDSTEEGIEIWRQAWNSLWEILKRTVSMMIAELAALFVWQVITGTAPMGGFGAGKMKGTPVNTIVPDPIGHGNFASIGNRPQIGHIGASSGNVDTSTMKRHTQSLDRLSQAIEANGGINVQLQIDGRDVRSSIKRVEHDLNVLGSLV